MERHYKDRKPDHKVIAVDFDGVIAKWDGIWRGGLIGEVIPGTREALQTLKNLGFKIVIYTTRLNLQWGSEVEHRFKEILAWLYANRIPYDEIAISGKPLADYYIDDRAIPFESWDQVLREIKNREGIE